MKKTLLSKVILLVTLLFTGMGNMWADEATISLGSSSTTWTASGNDYTATSGAFTLVYGKGSYSNSISGGIQSGELRIYAGTTFTISSEKTITKIVYTISNSGSGKNYTISNLTTEDNALENGTWTGSATSVTATTNQQTRVASVTITYEDAASDKEKPELIVETEVTLNAGLEKDVDELYATDSDGEVTFTSSDATVAEVVGSVLKAYKKGTATITVKVAESEDYAQAVDYISVTVTANDAVKPEGPATAGGSKFVKVTSTDDIVDGSYLIVYEDGNVAFNGALETLDAVSNTIGVTISENTIEADDDALAAIFTINTTDGTIQSASGNYIGVSSNSNGLKQTEDETTYTHNFSIDDSGNAVIAAAYQGSTMSLRFNKASNQNRFRYYSNSGQQAIQLYILEAGDPETTFTTSIGEAGWKTFVSSSNVTFPSTLTAYTVTAANETATLQQITKAKAGEPVLLKGTKGDYTIEVTEENVATAEGNLLKVSDESTTNGVYVLANKTNGVGFYKWTGGLLGAGRVYLELPSSVREFIGFADETTGISTVSRTVLHQEVYNLNGQRVAGTAKGLYIVNGKKMVIK